MVQDIQFSRQLDQDADQDAALRKFPRVEYPDAEAREVLHVASDELKIMLNRGCGNHAVRHARRLSCRLPSRI